MSTYLLFFGKSQSFLIKAFDESGTLIDFDNIINEFDLLESKNIIIDQFDNKQILSKYTFQRNGTTFSMLKLYSHAQSREGARVEGSIYGVALLSVHDLYLSTLNIKFLLTAKKHFAEQCLSNLKFTITDFTDKVQLITNALITQLTIFKKIQYSAELKFDPEEKPPVAFFFENYENLLQEKYSVLPVIRNCMYFSEDFSHLLRCYNRSLSKFDLYSKVDNNFIKYEPNIIKGPTNLLDNYESKINFQNNDKTKDELNELRKKYNYINSKTRKLKTFITILSFFLFVSFSYIGWISFSKYFSDQPKENKELKEVIINQDSIFTYKIYEIISDTSKLKSFNNMFSETYKYQLKQKKRISTDSLLNLYTDNKIDTINLRFYLIK
jgi:hypothetical protein